MAPWGGLQVHTQGEVEGDLGGSRPTSKGEVEGDLVWGGECSGGGLLWGVPAPGGVETPPP